MKLSFYFILAILIITAQVWFMGGLEKPDYVAPQWIKERHKYHGIQVSEIYRGEHTFMRDGKRCRL
jgi:hypothetical protein